MSDDVPSASPRTAAALIIGNELLSGKVDEQNLCVLAKTLRTLGVVLRRVVVIPDERETIVEELKNLSVRFDVVFTSGGIGPTHDDVTVEAVAEAFHTEVVSDPDMERLLRAHFGESLLPGHLLMARIPKGSVMVRTEDDAWPTVRMGNVWMLPGVPEIFRARLPAVRDHLPQRAPFVCREVYSNLDEGVLVPLLNQIVSEFPDVSVGSYPKWNDPAYKTKLTFDGQNRELVDRACEAFVALLPNNEPIRVN